MADIFETRCATRSFCGSKHLLRVACIGDSMMYGQGVAPRHTLPAHLARFLNAALPEHLVWVDNFGESSGNVWDAWAGMKRRAAYQQFDAVVFSVCDNDSMLLDTVALQYPGDDALYQRYWDEGTVQFRRLAAVFADLKVVCSKRAITPIVIFYTILTEDQPVVEIFGRLMQRLDIPFLNMLEFFRDRVLADHVPYMASEFDGHPSSLTHDLTARRITTELVKRLADYRPGQFTARRAEALGGALADLADQGVAVDVALEWGREVLSAKQRAARRRADDDPNSTRESAELVETLESCLQAWRWARRLEAQARVAPPAQVLSTGHLPNLFMYRSGLEELFISLETCNGNADQRELEELCSAKASYFEQGHFGPVFPGDVHEAIAGARARLAALLAIRPRGLTAAMGRLAGTSALLRQSIDPVATGWEIAWVTTMAGWMQDYLSGLEDVERRLSDEGADPIPALWTIIFSMVNNCLWVMEEVNHLFCAGVAIDAPLGGSPWTCVDVILEGSSDPEVAETVCGLIVEADYIVPERPLLRENLWAGTETQRGVYHFELPLMIHGNLRVGVRDNDPTREKFLKGTARIAQIEIYNMSADGTADGLTRIAQAADPAGAVPVITWREPDSRLSIVAFPGVVLP